VPETDNLVRTLIAADHAVGLSLPKTISGNIHDKVRRGSVRLQDVPKANRKFFRGDEAMIRALAASVALAVLVASLPAQAQQMLYIGNTMGVGSGKCATYKMDIEVAIDGTAVKGRIKQQGRTDRDFEATLGAGGVIKTKAVVGGGESMDVIGTINDKEARILLDGYCKFDFRLTRK
jgi:hypothetical protein